MSPSADTRPKTTQRRWTASPGATRDADRHRGDSLWHRRQTGPGLLHPESTRIRSHTRQVPETRTILPEKPDRAHAHGRRGRRGLRPPSADSQERCLSSTAQPPAPAAGGSARPLHVALQRGHLQGSLSSLRGAEAALHLPAARYNPSSWAAWDDAPPGAGAGRGLSTGAQGLTEAEAGRGDCTHRSSSSPSPADGQMAGSFVIHSRKGDPDSPPPEPAALGGTESGSDGPTVHGGRRRAGLRPAA